MSNIHKPEIVYSGNWAFRLVDPSTVLPEGEVVFKHTSYPKSFLEKFNVPPFDHFRAKRVTGDGKTPLEDMHYSYGTPNAIFYKPDLPLTEAYRKELFVTGERDYVAQDGNTYYPASLDCTPDLAVAPRSKREVISGANRYGSRLVHNSPQRQLGGITGWEYYMERSRPPLWDEGLLAEAEPPLTETLPEESPELDDLNQRVAELEVKVEGLLIRSS